MFQILIFCVIVNSFNMLQSLGVACAVTLCVVLLVNLTLAPVMLLTFDKFFSNTIKPFSCGKCKIEWGAQDVSFVNPKIYS